MKVLFISPVGFIGGAEKVLLQLIRGLRSEHEVTVLLMADGELRRQIEASDVAVRVLPLSPGLERLGDAHGGSKLMSALRLGDPRAIFRGLSYVRAMRSEIAQLKPDVIHTNGIKAHLLAAIARPAGPELVWHVHDYLGRRTRSLRLLRLLAGRADLAIGVSRSVVDDLKHALPALPRALVPNSVDAEYFCPGLASQAVLDELAGLPTPFEPVVRIGLVATYAQWKGHGLFLDAMAKLVNSGRRQVRGYIVGGAIYQTRESQVTAAELYEQIADRSLSQFVGLVPFQSDTLPVYRSLDVVVHASTLPEPFGLTVTEAMACGKAVVVADQGGAAEIVRHELDGLHYEMGNAGLLADALHQLVDDSTLRERLSLAAVKSARERYSPDKSIESLLSAYESLGIG
ncbi:MAG: glycosyltransferase family 4 protein [Pirellulales bacterium]